MLWLAIALTALSALQLAALLYISEQLGQLMRLTLAASDLNIENLQSINNR